MLRLIRFFLLLLLLLLLENLRIFSNFEINDLKFLCKKKSSFSLINNNNYSYFCANLFEKFFKCDQTHRIPVNLICDGFSHCPNQLDEFPLVCSNFRFCKNIFDLRVQDLTCSFSENLEKCPNSSFPTGINVKIRCKNYFFPQQDQFLQCLENSTWNNTLIKCTSDCGLIKENLEFKPLILNAPSIRPQFWPWYAALFIYENSRWTFFCSSTILNANSVITAAHCVQNLPKTLWIDVRVVAGKFSSDFYHWESENQSKNVENVHIHPLYQDALGNYGSDIAVIKLREFFEYSAAVFPVCMNWQIQSTDNFGITGKVAGMGITENGEISTNLRLAEVRILANFQCLHEQNYEFRKFVTIGTFCAQGIETGNRKLIGNRKLSVICNGDSGSGLIVKNPITQRWTLTGIVSISPKNPQKILCNENYSTIYTNIGIYTGWIKKLIN